ncbi:MAG: hypothetical protein RJA52_1099 [Bacteroidota bacterium]|jgi:glutamyl-tRNA synthetase
MRLRFAPSPTGALHIGGVRTALYNYLLAKQNNGTFILRIEDTDRSRYVPWAEKYIEEALLWCGIIPDESPSQGGNHGPYRQSDRKSIYQEHAYNLLWNHKAYYAFDTPEELESARASNPNFSYNHLTRMKLRNSLALSQEETTRLLENKTPFVLRMLVEPGQTISIDDKIRGNVSFDSSELDDKVILKADKMPTYHLANVVDDYLMKITDVIRGEEWLPSTAHHILLYRDLGWEKNIPSFAHLPLILKPDGKGKLSKRDGKKFGFPVFPLAWEGEENFPGFRENGFLPEALINFLALLGWNPGTEQEIFSMNELIQSFDIEKVGKSGARFDYDKAKWFNHQYIASKTNQELTELLKPLFEENNIDPASKFANEFCALMKDRVTTLNDFKTEGYYFFSPVKEYDKNTLLKKWNPQIKEFFNILVQEISLYKDFSPEALKSGIESLMSQHNLSPGQVLPIFRIALTGNMKGPGVFEMMAALGKENTQARLLKAFDDFDNMS